MKSIGIDIGTTTISVVLLDAASKTVEKRYTLPNNSFLPTSHPWERIQNVPLILSSIRSVLDEILSDSNDIASIGLTGQMHGIVYTNQNGEAVSPLYTWQDGRGDLPEYDGLSVCQQLRSRYHVSAASGYGMITHLYNHQRGLVPPNAVSFCTIADYVGMVLTSRRTPLVHVSQAAGLGLYDPKICDFHRNILADFGVDPLLIPAITTEFEAQGTFRGIPVYVSIGDNQASFLGSVADGESSVLVNVGTGSQISVLSPKPFEGHGIEARPLTRDSFLLVGSALCGGRAYAALQNFFREYATACGARDVPQYDVMQALLEQSPADSCWQVKTTFAGTRENPDECGVINQINIGNFHPAALIRGVLCGIADELYEMYTVIQKETDLKPTKLVASGNGVRRNSALQLILSQRFGLPLELVQNEEEAATGAAICSLNFKVD